jgi:hypothetical protein
MNNPTLLAALFIFLFSSVGAHAQTLIKSDPELSIGKNIVKSAIPTNTEKTFETPVKLNVAASRQQTYVRPTKEERFKRYASDAFGVSALIGSTFGATINQIGNDPPEWKKTAGGFGKRFASSYGTNAIRNTVSYGLSETFKLDNRFEKSGQKNIGKRLKHVFLGSYTTRTRNGKRIPDFPFVTGTYTASVIANEVWFPNRFGYKDGLRDGTISLGVRFGVNLLREFIFPK